MEKANDSTYNRLTTTSAAFTAELSGLESNVHYKVRSFVQDSITHYSESMDLGSPITRYIVTANPGGFIAAGLNSPITITGLTNSR